MRRCGSFRGGRRRYPFHFDGRRQYAHGAEIHKLRADGVDDSALVFGYTDFAAIAKGFGLRGANVTDVGQLKSLFDAYAAADKAEVWNIRVSDKVVTPSTQRGNAVRHGVR